MNWIIYALCFVAGGLAHFIYCGVKSMVDKMKFDKRWKNDERLFGGVYGP